MMEAFKISKAYCFLSLGKCLTPSYFAKAMGMKFYDLKNLLQ